MSHKPNAERFKSKRDTDIHSAKHDADDDQFDLERYLDEAEYRKEHEQPVYQGGEA